MEGGGFWWPPELEQLTSRRRILVHGRIRKKREVEMG
jgi:hypothetical protein